MTAIEIINKIEKNKKDRHIEPTHATLREIEEMAIEDGFSSKKIVRAELNQLWTEKKIQVGDNINGKYIKLL